MDTTPVTELTIRKRINRALAARGEAVYKASSEEERRQFGQYFIRVGTCLVKECRVNLKKLARELRVISSRERLIKGTFQAARRVPVICTNPETGAERFYPSLLAAKPDGFHPGGVSSCLKGKSKTTNGHAWRRA